MDAGSWRWWRRSSQGTLGYVCGTWSRYQHLSRKLLSHDSFYLFDRKEELIKALVAEWPHPWMANWLPFLEMRGCKHSLFSIIEHPLKIYYLCIVHNNILLYCFLFNFVEPRRADWHSRCAVCGPSCHSHTPRRGNCQVFLGILSFSKIDSSVLYDQL